MSTCCRLSLCAVTFTVAVHMILDRARKGPLVALDRIDGVPSMAAPALLSASFCARAACSVD